MQGCSSTDLEFSEFYSQYSKLSEIEKAYLENFTQTYGKSDENSKIGRFTNMSSPAVFF